jgi:hypothetical protein
MPVLHMFLQGVYSYVASAGINISSLLLFLLKVFPEYVKLTTFTGHGVGTWERLWSRFEQRLNVENPQKIWIGVAGAGG